MRASMSDGDVFEESEDYGEDFEEDSMMMEGDFDDHPAALMGSK